MTLSSWLAWGGAALAWLPLLMARWNLKVFGEPDKWPPIGTRVSILIPARDEDAAIGRAVDSALRSTNVEVEVVVFDDQSQDGTALVVKGLAMADARVRLLKGSPLPPEWAGKQRACQCLAEAARFDVLMFIDADVRLHPEAAARAAGQLLAGQRLGMVSGFPREVTVSLGERLVVPWIHLLLLGYLPMRLMRRRLSPAFSAACGQWVVARREAYFAAGGHAAAPLSRYDGISLPSTFRRAGWMTDLFDGGRLASCRMYPNVASVWRGFGKSAGEGMATPRALPVWTVLIGGGHVLPWVLLPIGLLVGNVTLAAGGAFGIFANLALRFALRRCLHLSLLTSVLHPFGAMLVLAINWQALLRHVCGRPSTWRGRAYVGGSRRVEP